MLLKIAGMLLTFTVCAAWGMRASVKLNRRVRELEGFLGAVGCIATEIRYSAPPVEDILRRLSGMREYAGLLVFELCAGEFAGTRNLSDAFARALEQARRRLSIVDDDARVLLEFGQGLGATDVEGQLANCARCDALLSQRLDTAREDERRRGKLFSSLGVLAGVFFVVLFL